MSGDPYPFPFEERLQAAYKELKDLGFERVAGANMNTSHAVCTTCWAQVPVGSVSFGNFTTYAKGHYAWHERLLEMTGHTLPEA